MPAPRLNQQLHLNRRPSGRMTPLDFRLVETPIVSPEPGEVLVRQRWLSIDPYMRERMNDVKSYLTPQPLHEVMGGGGAREVVQSNLPDFVVGDQVVGGGGSFLRL